MSARVDGITRFQRLRAATASRDFSAGGFDSGRLFLATRLNRLGSSEAGRVETMVRVSGILWSGLLVGCRVVSTRVACSSRPGSTSLEVVKLVEPTCDEGAGRVETMVRVSGILWSGLLVGCRVVSTRVARSSRPGSTSFGGGARDPAQPASARSALLPSSGPLSAFLVRETRVGNGSTLCGDVEPSSFRDSCTGRVRVAQS